MRKIVLISGAIVFLGCPTFAHAQRAPVPVKLARRAVTTYEALYWKGQSVALRVDDCRRERGRTSCLAKATYANTVVNTRDYVSRLHTGDLRVHPGLSETTIVLVEQE